MISKQIVTHNQASLPIEKENLDLPLFDNNSLGLCHGNQLTSPRLTIKHSTSTRIRVSLRSQFDANVNAITMNTEHGDHRNDADKDVSEPADGSYRTAFRSKILKRIYEKNARYSPDIIENTLQNENILTKHLDDGERGHQQTLRTISLRNEWRKTHERILNPSYLDGQLEVSRKDALAFFIQKEWPVEDETEEKTGKGRRGKKKSKKLPLLERELGPIVVKSKVTWKTLADSSTTKISSILSDNNEDSEAIETIKNYALPKNSSLYERFILRSLQSREYLYQLGYLFRRNESSKAFRFFRWLYDCFVQYNTGRGKLIKSLQTAQLSPRLNNNRFLLEVTQAEISFSKHYLMDEECKLLRLLNVAFEQYQKSISARINHKLMRTNEVIEVVFAKIKNSTDITDKNEHQLDVDLLRRLVDFHRATISTRRKSLIELLRVWDRVVSHKSTSKLVTSGCLNLSLEEAINVDEEQERAEWNKLIEVNVSWEKVLKIDNSEINGKNVQSLIYLHDGRLPGEPKFKHVELIYSCPDEESTLDLFYTIQISIGEKNFVQFEPINLRSDFSNLTWNQSVTVAFPWFKNIQHSDYVSMSKTGSSSEINQSNFEDYCEKFLPKISIYEKTTKPTSELKLVCQIPLTELPRFYQKSIDSAKHFETKFEATFKEDNSVNRLRIKGTLELCTYWASIPCDAKTAAESAELVFDQEKRQIKRMTDLKAVDQALHDLRYLNAISLEAYEIDESSNSGSMRRIQLIELCLRQKYYIELNSNLLLKEENTQKSKQKFQSEKTSDQKDLDPGTFCTEEEIEQNKRFQLMIYRNSGVSQNQRTIRFIPLNNVTSVMLQNAMLSDKAEKISIELLLEFIQSSCDDQLKRLQGFHRKKTKKKKNADNGAKIFHDWCLLVSAIDGSASRQFMSAPNLIETISIVLEKFTFNQQSPSSEAVHNNGFFSANSRILSYKDIIREDTMESLETSEFSLFSPFANMSRSKLNPSRKDRRKVAITLSEALEREVQVVLSVQHALNVPLRMNPEEIVDDEEDDDSDRFTPCATFVEVAFDNQRISTSIAEGPQPTWNENFRFKIKLDPRQHISLSLFEVLKSVRSNSLSSDQSKSAASSKSPTEQEYSLHQEASDQELNIDSVMHLEKRYFGQFKVPLIAILLNSKVEGTFTLSSPYFLTDYKSISSSSSQMNKRSRQKLLDQSEETETSPSDDAKMISTVRQIKSLYLDEADQTLLGTIPDIALAFFITIDPSIEPLSGIQFSTKNESVESAELVEHCNRWRMHLSSQFPHRHFLCLVENIRHKLVLICRYLMPIKPPDLKDLISLEKLMAPKGKAEESAKKTRSVSMKKLVNREAIYLQTIIRFVSLIPSFSQNSPKSNSDQFWWQLLSKPSALDITQFLSLRVGFRIEHAIYLCCMLQYLDRNAFLLYGNSLTEGPTGHVILYPATAALSTSSKDENANEYEPVVINAKTGEQFGVRDFNITIHSIDCIVTSDNVYANIQKNTHPNTMQYNLRKSSHWQPLFGSAKDVARFTSKEDNDDQNETFTSIQPEVIDYSNSVDMKAASNLELHLENYLREQLMNWRRQQAVTFTAFNRYCTQVIRRILPQLEVHACLAATSGSMYSQRQQVVAIEEALLQELAEVHSVHNIIGFPLHCRALIDFEQIAQLVYSTGVHSLDGTFGGATRLTAQGNSKQALLEYVIAAYVHVYPANVHSIWVYVGALIPKT